jgi:phosphoenolpyruvate carboxykinase (ATP)
LPSAATKRSSPPRGRWWHEPASILVAPRRDKFTVKEPTTEQNINWGMNKALTESNFDSLHRDMMTYIQDKELYVLDAWGGADPAYRVPVRVVTEFRVAQPLRAQHVHSRAGSRSSARLHRPEYTVIDCPGFKADPARHGSRTETAIYVHYGRKLVLIAGSEYAGEIKKSIFTILNYTLPLKGVLSMHLLGERGPGRRLGAVLRPVRDRQDDAFERSGPRPDRR